jgi:hypothetical protein
MKFTPPTHCHQSPHMSIEGQLLWQKAAEIITAVKLIADIVPYDNENLLFVKNEMMYNACLLQAKFRCAEAAELYDIKMENACLM